MLKPLTYLALTIISCTPFTAIGQEQIPFRQPGSDSIRDRYLRAMTCYVIDGVQGSFDPKCQLTSAGIINTKGLPESASEELRESFISGSNFFDMARLRQWWNTWAYPSRERRSQSKIITNDLEAFKKNTGFKSWPSEVIAPSAVKNKTRVIYRSPATFTPGISVAETYDNMTGDLTSSVLETEIAIDRMDGSENADFYAYNHSGQLSTTSHFPAGERAVPGFCLGCHHAPARGTFGRLDWAER